MTASNLVLPEKLFVESEAETSIIHAMICSGITTSNEIKKNLTKVFLHKINDVSMI